MKLTLFIFTISIFLVGCSSRGENKSTQANQSNSNELASSNANSKLVPLEGVNSDAFNAQVSTSPNSNQNTVKDLKPINTPAPAPDNSTNETKMLPDGSFLETRMFANHSQLLKVEKRTDGQKVSMKVFLKNGKMIEVAADKLPTFHTDAPGNILIAAGINPDVPKGQASSIKGSSQSEQKVDSKTEQQ